VTPDAPDPYAPLTFRLRGGRAVEVLREGLRAPGVAFLGRAGIVPWSEITHLAPGRRHLRIGTTRGVRLLSRTEFVEPADAQVLLREIVARIAAGPEGRVQLARMAAIEERWRHPAPVRATPALAALCVLVFGVQLASGHLLEEVAAFGATLARVEPWRYVTGNLLHASFPILHLPLNLLAIFAFGLLVERALGAAATAFVMTVSGLAAMAGAALAGLEGVVGASGIAMGLVGAMLWLEYRHADALPAAWRVPRRVFVVLLVAENLLFLFVPWVATSGHLGGLAGGALAAALVSAPLLRQPEAPRWLVAADVLLGVAVVASVSAAGLELARGEAEILPRRGERLLSLEHAPPELLNDTAWMIAISPEPTPPALDVALRLAERAVDESGRTDANILDTLAEVLFRLGQPAEAVDTIDEAIALEPGQVYFREQRRRFTGERDFEDRPPPPGLPFGLPPGDPFEGAPPGIPI
jgi:membrane associated rhomboid family serine protease